MYRQLTLIKGMFPLIMRVICNTFKVIFRNNELFFLFLHAEVVIGFINAPYIANERDGRTAVTFGVISGTLGRRVTVILTQTDGSALCKYTVLRSHS